MRADTLRLGLLGTASVLGLWAGHGTAQGQTLTQPALTPPSQADAGGVIHLGTIEIGDSKRAVQTETAQAETRIDQVEIDDRQAGTVAELIDTVPGVTLVNGSTPTGSGISIRGFGATSSFGTDQKVLITVDGATSGAEELYRIGNQLFTDPQLFRRVSVLRGTVGSFEYGSGVVGGVVRLETKDASDFTGGEVGLRFRQVLEAASNGQGFTTASTAAWQASDRFELLANVTRRSQDNQKDGDGAVIANSAFTMPSYLVKGRYRFGASLEHALTASVNGSTVEEKDVPYDTFGTTGGVFGNVDRTVETQVVGLRYQYTPTDNDLVNLDVNLTYSDQKIDSTYIKGSSSGGPAFDPIVGPTGDADHRYQTTKLTAKNTAYFQTGGVAHDLRTGVELIHKKRLDAISAPGGTDRRLALFVVDEMRAGGNWVITPALRWERQLVEGTDIIAPGETLPHDGKFTNSALMGGLSLRYEFDNGFAVFASAAYTESLPIIDDLSTPLFMTQPEKSRTWEIGASWLAGDLFAAGDELRAKVNLYDTALWDVTSYTDAARRTIARVDTQGVELEASYAHGSGFYADFNATLGDGTETSGSGVESRWRSTPADNARLTLGRKIDAAWDVSWELAAAQSVTSAAGAVTPGYGVQALRATWAPQAGVLQGAELRLGVENLTDRAYRPYLATRNAPGRTVKVTLAKTF